MANEESNNHHQLIDSPSPMNGGCGEIVEVEGGHIIRSTGKKDRHSKVCTAKGPRDRRVRLSAPTAIQFYDVQDRLGFDRPSKAVDWLIEKAKSSIDDLEKLPPWNPIDTLRTHSASNSKPRRSKTLISPPATTRETEHHHQETEHHHRSFLPASMDSNSIADTIKSFFPVVSTELPLPPSHQSQDLRLSLQSFATQTEQPALFSSQSNNPLGFDSSWDQQPPEFGRIQRLVTWNNGGGAESAANGGGFVFASPATTTTSFQPVYGQSQVFSQRGPLQSINTPMIRAWFDPHHHHQSTTIDDNHRHHPYHIPSAIHQSAIPGIAFASNGEFTGFRIPARFQGEQEEHHGDNNKPSSASSDSRH